jgi:hypothetical protein
MKIALTFNIFYFILSKTILFNNVNGRKDLRREKHFLGQTAVATNGRAYEIDLEHPI